MTNETKNANIPESPTIDSSQSFSLILNTFLSLFLGYDSTIHSLPLKVLYLTALSAPLILGSAILLRGRLVPGSAPARWPEGSAKLLYWKRAQSLFLGAVLLSLAFYLYPGHFSRYFFAPSFLATNLHSNQDVRVAICHNTFWLLLGWLHLLQAFIQTRKPLPPRREFVSQWAGMKSIHSDHWGEPTAH